VRGQVSTRTGKLAAGEESDGFGGCATGRKTGIGRQVFQEGVEFLENHILGGGISCT
jgi:hypothetical protein